MNKYFDLFDELGDSQKKYTCASTETDFLIYVFLKEEIDVSKELEEINCLAKKHSL